MSLTVRDVLLLPRLQSLHLRAGQAGERRTVRWPYVIENDSIADWVLGGELVFVTGINRPRDEANLLRLVREADQRECAGLVILTGPRYIDHIPDSVLAEADCLGVPLIEQPYELPLVVVTEAIGSALVQAQLLGSSRERFVEQLLDGSLTDPALIAHRTASLGIELGPPLPVVSQGSQWVALLPMAGPEADGDIVHLVQARNRAAVESLLHALDGVQPPLRILAGLSTICPQPTDLARGLGQARQALTAARALPGPLRLCRFEDLGVLELLLAIPDRSLIDRFVTATLGPLLQHDKAHPGVLTPTLEAWIQANGNLVAAARRLNVHRNTLQHRMHQIEALIGLDLQDAQRRLDIAVALMIWRLSPHHPIPRNPA